jgi:hypothetical protein
VARPVKASMRLTSRAKRGVNTDLKSIDYTNNTLRTLASSFRQTALEQLMIIARSVSEASVVSRKDKIAVLYDALDEIAKIIDNLSAPIPASDLELWVNWNRKVKEKIRDHQPLDSLEQTRNPFLFAERFYGDGCPLAVIGRRDPSLAKALQDWERRRGNDTGLKFPVERDENDRLIALVGENPDFNTLPASKLLQVRTLLRMKNFLAVRRSRTGVTKRAG